MLASAWLAIVRTLFAIAGISFSLALNIPPDGGSGEASEGIFGKAAPRFVAYSDDGDSIPDPNFLSGYNVFAISFLLVSGPADQALNWGNLSPAQRAEVKSRYKAAGISLMVSAFGATDAPTSNGADPIDTANKLATWVRKHNLDGIDVDYEDFDAFEAGTAIPWVIKFTKQLRSQLPAESYIISHAPIAPWDVYSAFSPHLWSGGGYLKVHQVAGSLIDWYNIQFYNQGRSEYTTCHGLLTASSSSYPNSAVFQIAANGIPFSKIVIGKPGIKTDADDYMDPHTLATCLKLAKDQGWDGGAMVWEYPDVGNDWIETVRSLSWPT